jgi:hypothetical protein
VGPERGTVLASDSFIDTRYPAKRGVIVLGRRNRLLTPEATGITQLAEEVRILARPLHDTEDLDPLLGRIGAARYVLLGEASHGTADYYTWRARVNRRLIEKKGFSFIAVEGDWPDCYRVNRYVKGFADGGESAHEVLRSFARWPTWMWPTVLPRWYDAFLYLDETEALHPLHVRPRREQEVPETFPTGV